MINLQTYLIGGVAGVALLAATGFLAYNKGYDNGANSVQVKYDEYKLATEKRIDKFVQEQKDLKIKLNEANNITRVKTVTEFVTKDNFIVETKVKNQKVIEWAYVNSPYLTKGIVYTHDQLALGLPIDQTLAQDESPTGYSWVQLMGAVGTNYATLNSARVQLEGINKFYEEVRTNNNAAVNDGLQND